MAVRARCFWGQRKGHNLINMLVKSKRVPLDQPQRVEIFGHLSVLNFHDTLSLPLHKTCIHVLENITTSFTKHTNAHMDLQTLSNLFASTYSSDPNVQKSGELQIRKVRRNACP